MVMGALLTFSYQDELPKVKIGVAGLILMVAGGAVIAHARATAAKERVVTTREESGDPTVPVHVVEEIVLERRRD